MNERITADHAKAVAGIERRMDNYVIDETSAAYKESSP